MPTFYVSTTVATPAGAPISGYDASSTHSPANTGTNTHSVTVPATQTGVWVAYFWTQSAAPFGELSWPTTDYGYSADVSAIGADITVNSTLQRTSTTGLPVSTTVGLTLTSFTGTGIKTQTGLSWSSANVNPATGTASTDRLQWRASADNASMMLDQSVTFLLSDSQAWITNPVITSTGTATATATIAGEASVIRGVSGTLAATAKSSGTQPAVEFVGMTTVANASTSQALAAPAGASTSDHVLVVRVISDHTETINLTGPTSVSNVSGTFGTGADAATLVVQTCSGSVTSSWTATRSGGTGSGTSTVLRMHYRNVDSVSALTPRETAGTSHAGANATVTVPVDGSLAHGAVANADITGQSFTPPTSWSERYDGNDLNAQIALSIAEFALSAGTFTGNAHAFTSALSDTGGVQMRVLSPAGLFGDAIIPAGPQTHQVDGTRSTTATIAGAAMVIRMASGTTSATSTLAGPVDITLLASGTLTATSTTAGAGFVTREAGSTTGTTATAYTNQHRLDRCQNGVLWSMWWDGTSTTADSMALTYSTDNGDTWTDPGSSSKFGFASTAATYTPNGSFFIDLDDYAHVVYKDRADGFIYYRRGTPNAGRTAWTWTSALAVFDSNTNADYPDLVVHREGTGWKAHLVISYTTTTPFNTAAYARLNITSGGTVTIDSNGMPNALGANFGYDANYSLNVHTYPSVDFHHTGNAKTVASSTPHVYLGMSAGGTGAGKGVRFKKATYSGGSWTWGTEREIDSARVLNTINNAWLQCQFDGTRVNLYGLIHDGTSYDLMIYERDVADTTTTTRLVVDNVTSVNQLWVGSATYDSLGDVHFVGRGFNGSSTLNYVKWTRSNTTLGAYTVLIGPSADVRTGAWVSMKRGYSNSRVEWITTYKSASPYIVKYGSVALASTVGVDGTLAPAATLAGAGFATVVVGGTQSGTATLSAAAVKTAIASGTLSGTATHAGVAARAVTVDGTTTGTSSLAGAGLRTAGIDGTVSSTAGLSAVAVKTAIANGTFTVTGAPAGTGANTAVVAGTASSTATHAGAAARAVLVDGTTTSTGALAGATTLTVGVSGALSIATTRDGAQTVTVTVAGTQAITGTLSGTAAAFWAGPVLTATVFSTTQIDLSWTAVTNAEAYEIERDSVVIVANHLTTSYSDTGLTPGGTYAYRVRAKRTV